MNLAEELSVALERTWREWGWLQKYRKTQGELAVACYPTADGSTSLVAAIVDKHRTELIKSGWFSATRVVRFVTLSATVVEEELTELYGERVPESDYWLVPQTAEGPLGVQSKLANA